MAAKLRVLLADDHNVVRAGLRALIDAQPDMEVVAEAADGEAACRLAAELTPDVAVLDALTGYVDERIAYDLAPSLDPLEGYRTCEPV